MYQCKTEWRKGKVLPKSPSHSDVRERSLMLAVLDRVRQGWYN